MMRHFIAGLMIAGVGFLNGCYSPGGGMFSKTDGPVTIASNQMTQKSVSLIDMRTNDVIVAIDIPPLKQLTIDFEKGEGDDPVMTPDLMRYQIQDMGTKFGKLENSMTVPDAASRRLDLHVRQRVEFAEAPPTRPLRTDETADRPDWWTPRGGPMPEERNSTLYDN